MKPIKEKPAYSEPAFAFDKTKPLSQHNFPLTTYTMWQIYGYKKDKLTGLKIPYWINKKLPTSIPLTPKKVGLDGFFTVKPIYQQW